MRKFAVEQFNDVLIDWKGNIYCPNCQKKLAHTKDYDQWFCMKVRCTNVVVYTIGGKVREEE